jgi:hypothetical protein
MKKAKQQAVKNQATKLKTLDMKWGSAHYLLHIPTGVAVFGRTKIECMNRMQETIQAGISGAIAQTTKLTPVAKAPVALPKKGEAPKFTVDGVEVGS